MNQEPKEAYVYQPYPVTHGENIYGVAGLAVYGYSGEPLKGISKKDAEAIVDFCKRNPEFAGNFIRGMKEHFDKTNHH